MKPLRLHLKHEYWDAIAAGEKPFEYRLASKWLPRLQGKEYSEIHLLRGYPAASNTAARLIRPWRGYTLESITHPHFGPGPVAVLAIPVSEWRDLQPDELPQVGDRVWCPVLEKWRIIEIPLMWLAGGKRMDEDRFQTLRPLAKISSQP